MQHQLLPRKQLPQKPAQRPLLQLLIRRQQR